MKRNRKINEDEDLDEDLGESDQKNDHGTPTRTKTTRKKKVTNTLKKKKKKNSADRVFRWRTKHHLNAETKEILQTHFQLHQLIR